MQSGILNSKREETITLSSKKLFVEMIRKLNLKYLNKKMREYSPAEEETKENINVECLIRNSNIENILPPRELLCIPQVKRTNVKNPFKKKLLQNLKNKRGCN